MRRRATSAATATTVSPFYARATTAARGMSLSTPPASWCIGSFGSGHDPRSLVLSRLGFPAPVDAAAPVRPMPVLEICFVSSFKLFRHRLFRRRRLRRRMTEKRSKRPVERAAVCTSHCYTASAGIGVINPTGAVARIRKDVELGVGIRQSHHLTKWVYRSTPSHRDELQM